MNTVPTLESGTAILDMEAIPLDLLGQIHPTPLIALYGLLCRAFHVSYMENAHDKERQARMVDRVVNIVNRVGGVFTLGGRVCHADIVRKDIASRLQTWPATHVYSGQWLLLWHQFLDCSLDKAVQHARELLVDMDEAWTKGDPDRNWVNASWGCLITSVDELVALRASRIQAMTRMVSTNTKFISE